MPKILVIEDDADMVTAIRMPLEANDYEVFEAATGEEGLRKVKEVEPDLIILDVMMPGKSGYDVCRKIRKEDAHVPVLFLSAKGEEIDKVLHNRGIIVHDQDFLCHNIPPFATKPSGSL